MSDHPSLKYDTSPPYLLIVTLQTKSNRESHGEIQVATVQKTNHRKIDKNRRLLEKWHSI